MAGNRIFRGPMGDQPETVSDKTVAGAYLPGTFVIEGAAQLTQATAFGPMLRLLGDRDFYGTDWTGSASPLKAAYAAGETGVAFKLRPTQEYQGAVAAATYTFGQELTVGAAGRLVAAATGDKVIGFAKEAGAKAAGDLIDFEVVNVYTK